MSRSSKASKAEAAKVPDKEAQQEQKLILKDVREGMLRAAVVPAAYSVEEFLLGCCKFEEIRLKSIRLTEDEVRVMCVHPGRQQQHQQPQHSRTAVQFGPIPTPPAG